MAWRQILYASLIINEAMYCNATFILVTYLYKKLTQLGRMPIPMIRDVGTPKLVAFLGGKMCGETLMLGRRECRGG